MVIDLIFGQFSLRAPLIGSLVVVGLDLLYVVFVMPETKMKEDFPFEWKRANPFRSFYVLTQSKLVLGLSSIYFFSFLGEAGFLLFGEFLFLIGILDTVVLFLKYKFHFGAFEIGVALSILGFCFILQGFFIYPLTETS